MFVNPVETQPQLPEELASKERLARRNVEALGTEVERLTGERDRLSKEGGQAKKILEASTRLFIKKQEEVEAVEAMLATLKGEYEQKESEAKTAFDLQSALFGKSVVGFNSELERLRKEVEGQRKVNEKLLSDSSVLTAKIHDKEEKLAGLKSNITAAKKELKALQVQAVDVEVYLATQRVLEAQIAALEAKASELTKTEEGFERSLSSLQKSVSKLVADKEKVADEMKTEREANDKAIAEKNAELEAREGVVSDKEAWLKKKEDTLRQVKQDLEIFYGRKINLTI